MSEEISREEIAALLARESMSKEMTREQAKGNLIHAIRWNDMPKKEALEMAIKALEQEPCEDTISRRKAINVISACDGKSAQIEALEQLPSVTPKQRTGHWIFEEGDGKTCFDGYVCSACNKSFHTHVPYFAEYEFCPHCGADMRESEEQA